MHEFYRVVGKDKEYAEIERAFAYGMGLNRQGKKPLMPFREQWRTYFHDRELRRILNVLVERKAKSICGDRDPCF